MFSKYLQLRYDLQEEWEVETIQHAKQQDSVSCGIFCMKVHDFLCIQILQIFESRYREEY